MKNLGFQITIVFIKCLDNLVFIKTDLISLIFFFFIWRLGKEAFGLWLVVEVKSISYISQSRHLVGMLLKQDNCLFLDFLLRANSAIRYARCSYHVWVLDTFNFLRQNTKLQRSFKGELNPKIGILLFEHLGIVEQLYEVFFLWLLLSEKA